MAQNAARREGTNECLAEIRGATGITQTALTKAVDDAKATIASAGDESYARSPRGYVRIAESGW
jgi:DNA-binding XRE family transcriptional regulator